MTDDVLTVADVLALYHLRDRRAARRLMDDAGSFVVGGKLLVRRSDLLAHEQHLREQRRSETSPGEKRPEGQRRRGARREKREPGEALPPDWWKER